MTSTPPRGSNHNDDKTDGIPSISILGVGVHRVDMETTLNLIQSYIHSGRPHIIVTADSSGIVLAQTDSEFRDIVNGADLVTPDSSGVLIGAKWLGMPLTGRVSGVDIAENVCRIAAEEGFPIFFLGAGPGVAEQAAANLRERYPGLQVAGSRHGYFGDAENAEVVAEVKRSGAKVVFVALGIPRQEKWIAEHIDELGVCVAMGVGGSFDVFSGNVKRAPVWMQRHCLEWAYRLAMDPRKISKVASLPRFLGLVLREKFRRKA